VVNGERVRSAQLKSGDQIAVGQNYFLLRDTSQPAPKEWPKPMAPPPQPAPSSMRTAFDGVEERNGSIAAAVAPDEASWSRYLLDPEKLQRKIAAAALDLTSAVRSYVLTASSGASRYRVLAAHTSTGNPDGPPINDTIVHRVLRTKAPIAVEGGAGVGNTGAACVPLMGTDRCVGAIYVDGGLSAMSFSPSRVEQLEQLGNTAGRLLQTAASLKTALAEKRGEGVRDVAKAAGDVVSRLLDRLSGPNGVHTQLQAAAHSKNPAELDEAQRSLAACIATIEGMHANFLALGHMFQHEPLPMDANLVVEQVVARLEPVAKAKGVRLDFQRGNRAIVYADDRDLACALTNILRNAIDASAAGSAVTIGAENKIDGCTIGVEDSGNGMPEDIRAAIASGGDLLGFGFGLAAAKAALERSKGDWRVQAGRDGGTTVTLVLPQREA
jgi:K+-sensing histidine kinase KdpD